MYIYGHSRSFNKNEIETSSKNITETIEYRSDIQKCPWMPTFHRYVYPEMPLRNLAVTLCAHGISL